MRSLARVAAVLWALLSVAPSRGQGGGEPLRLEQEIALPGVDGRIDHFAVDRKKRAVVTRWGLGGPLANYPLALDETNQRVFVGCRLPARLVALDAGSGRVVATLPTVGDSDDVFYDAERRRVYVIGGEGAVDLFRQRDPDHYERLGRVPTASGARTGLFVPAWSRLYVAVPHRGSSTAKVLAYRVNREAP
jgi:hypothetical protein